MQQLKAVQQIQAIQQAAATQMKLQQVQAIIAAQQKHVQNVQQMVARHRQTQKLSATQSPTGTTPPPGATPSAKPPLPSIQRHQAMIQKALAQVSGVPGAGTVPRHAAIQQRVQKLSASIARMKSHGGGPQGPSAASLQPGRHHMAVIKAALQGTRTGSRQLGQVASQNKVTQHPVFRIIQSRALGRPHQQAHQGTRQQAIFKHIHGKLAHRHKGQQQPAQTTAPAPAPAPAPATKTAALPGSSLGSSVPLPSALPSTSLASAVKNVVQSATSSTQNDPGSSGSLGGATMSKLGGPQDPKQPNATGPGNSRNTRKDDDDDDGAGSGNTPKGGTKSPGRPIALQPMEILPALGSYNPRQVLAVGLSDTALRSLVDRKFRVVQDFQFKHAVGAPKLTQLELPPGENAINSLTKLQETVPDASFALNRVYAPYRLGAGGTGSGTPLQKGSIGCTADRCFGTGLIKWQPEVASCAKDVRVGIIDTGHDGSHPTFAKTRITQATFAPKNSAPAAQDHGTGILALLAGSQHSSTPGLIPHADYYMANAFYAEASGGPPVSDTTDLLRALDWLKSKDVAIINLSFAGPKDDLVHLAIKRLARSGVIFVAAAGNEGPHAPPRYPAAYQEVVAVTAVDRNLTPYRYANRGAYIDVAAPGVGIWTALPGNREGVQTGTSFAVPFVTAVLAMNHARLEGESGSALAPKRRALEILQENVMRLGGADQRSEIFGAGLVQAPASCPPAPGVAVAKSGPSLPPWTSSVAPSTEAPQAWTTNTFHAATVKSKRP